MGNDTTEKNEIQSVENDEEPDIDNIKDRMEMEDGIHICLN